MPKRSVSRALAHLILVFVLVGPCLVGAAPLRVLSSSPEGLTLRLELPPFRVTEMGAGSQVQHDLVAPDLPRLGQPGQAALPFVAALIAAPPDARIRIEVRPLRHTDRTGISYVGACGPDPAAPGSQELDALYAQLDIFGPERWTTTEYLGIMRGARAHALRIYPIRYNPARRILRVYDRLEIDVRFEGGGRPKSVARSSRAVGQALHAAFLNPSEAAGWSGASPAPKPAAPDWYDPSRPWVKFFVEEDGLHRLGPEWLERRKLDPEGIDPRTFRLVFQGEEQAVYVRGEEDGRFDPEDYLVFHGRFRRDEKDFESLYGKRNIYWLTWGREPGQRLRERSAAPDRDYPISPHYWTTAHFERDQAYDPLPDAPDNQRDHWFYWPEPLLASKVDVPSSHLAVVDLDQPQTGFEYTARIRVALHGAASLGHHTMIQLNNKGLDDRIIDEQFWEGQTELLIEKEIPGEYVNRGTNRLLVKAFADRAKWDRIHLNWFEVDYLRLHRARAGYLEFAHPQSDGHRIRALYFAHPDIEIFDLANRTRLADAQIESLGETFMVTFDDVAENPALYVAADSLATITPLGLEDQPSFLRDAEGGADYLIITHRRLLPEVQPLAEHRQAGGLQVRVVDVEDIYDEYAHGLVDREAVRSFINDAYHHWNPRPAYVLLVGDVTYDYRNVKRSGQANLVPTLYYHARGRGHSSSDYQYALVDGDDILPDLAIGRLAVETAGAARQVVEKIIRYDLEPEAGDWRRRVIYAANSHETNMFTEPSDELAARYTEPLGLESVRIYNQDETPIPNLTGRAFVDALNAGALLLNYSGHGGAAHLAWMFSLDMPDWGYLGHVQNGARLPLVVALSCFNGIFVIPGIEGLAEIFTEMPDGGAIAYISASAKSYVAQNNLLDDRLFNQFFVEGNLEFGPALNAAKVQVLAAHSSYREAALTMQLLGDPAQQLALPRRADYVAAGLRIAPEQVSSHATVAIEASLRNHGQIGPDSLEVAVLAYGAAPALPETLYCQALPPFAGAETVSLSWAIGDRSGPHRLELRLDEADRIGEIDENNNLLQLDLEILEPQLPIPIFPTAYGVVPFAELSLEAAVPLNAAAAACEFSVSEAPEWEAESAVAGAVVAPDGGLAGYRPGSLVPDQSYYWKVRLRTASGHGPWSLTRSFRTGTVPTLPAWHQQGPQLLAGESKDVELGETAQVQVSRAALPMRPASAREDGFTVRGLEGAGVVCTDGTYLYAKRWYNDDSTIYPGIDFFTRVGTGYNGTRQDLHYGTLADSTTAGVSATYHADGYIYNDSGRAFELERISVATGVLDTVAVPDGLLEWQSGQAVDGHSLLTSDGRYLYNVSMSSEAGVRNEWGVRVFDPGEDMALVRAFASPPTETGFTFEWTDGVLADGERLYLIEHGGQRRVRMVDAFDGRFLDEWTSDQDTTRIITGQYDWVNNKAWLGDLWASAIYRYGGTGRTETGQVTSAPVGPAASWHRAEIAAAGAVLVDVLAQDSETEDWAPLPGLVGLAANQEVDLGTVAASEHRRIRLRARLSRDPDEGQLVAWSADFSALPSLRVARPEARLDSSGLRVEVQVRNLSAASSGEARLRLEIDDGGEAVAERKVGLLQRGQTRRVVMDSLPVPPAGARLFARVLAAQPDADPVDNRIEVPLLLGGRAPLAFTLWPDDRPFLPGDALRPGQGLLIQPLGLTDAIVALAVDGVPTEPDSVLAPPTPDEGARILYRPKLDPGTHRLQVRLFREQEAVGFLEIRFVLAASLRLANPLVYPHPVSDRASFTYVLSHDAEVDIEIYSLSGRLVRRLARQAQTAGFQQVAWDGRNRDGQPLANGTYLYRILASDSSHEAEFRGPLSVVR